MNDRAYIVDEYGYNYVALTKLPKAKTYSEFLYYFLELYKKYCNKGCLNTPEVKHYHYLCHFIEQIKEQKVCYNIKYLNRFKHELESYLKYYVTGVIENVVDGLGINTNGLSNSDIRIAYINYIIDKEVSKLAGNNKPVGGKTND